MRGENRNTFFATRFVKNCKIYIYIYVRERFSSKIWKICPVENFYNLRIYFTWISSREFRFRGAREETRKLIDMFGIPFLRKIPSISLLSSRLIQFRHAWTHKKCVIALLALSRSLSLSHTHTYIRARFSHVEGRRMDWTVSLVRSPRANFKYEYFSKMKWGKMRERPRSTSIDRCIESAPRFEEGMKEGRGERCNICI